MPTTPPARLQVDRAARESNWIVRRVRAVAQAVRFAPAPPIGTPKAMARTAGLLYVAAATISLVALLLPQQPGVRILQETMLGVIALGVGVTLIAVGHRWQRWRYHIVIFIGNIIIALAVYDGGGGATSMAYASLYVFVALNCFFFFAWPSACFHLAVAMASCVFALVVLGDANFGQVILVPGTLVVVAATVGWLVRAAGAAEVDALTGLPNRRGLDRALTAGVMDAALGASKLSLVFLDVDHFRAVNVSGGQAGGDRLLRTIAIAWRALIGEGELLARYGGDEFALLLTNAQPGDVVALTDRLRAAMPDGHTCSAGAADWESGDTVSLLSARADAALYESKRAGRNRLTHHDSNQAHEEAALRRAIDAGEVVAYYMPIVELATGVVTGVEALARWIRPGHGVVFPDDFIPQAEASGAIEDIGKAMLVAACRQVRVWSKIHGWPFVANVNVCGRELRNPGYVAQVRAILLDADLPASQLLLELTETAFEGNADPVIAALGELHAMGVGIAIDDFGTGYSSLSRLDRLPVDIVKIDRSFVSPLPPEATRAPLVAAITAMARALGLRVVAEGIEYPYQAALMLELGCDEGQGYWFDRPCAADQVDLSKREPALKITLAAGEGDVPMGLSVVG